MARLRDLLRRPPLLNVAIDRGEGPPVVLIHGIASSSVTFEHVIPHLDGRYRVIAIDLLGFGDSPAPPDSRFTVADHVASLHRTIRALRLREPFVLVGHSMGTIVGARYAAQYPREVRRLVLVSPPVYFAPEEVGHPADRAAMGLYFRAYEFLRANKDFTIRAAAALAKLSPIQGVLDVSERNWTAFVRSLENCIETQSTVADLARVRAPVHAVWGTLDPFLSPAGLRILEAMRNVTTHKVTGGDHVIRPRMARVVATAIG